MEENRNINESAFSKSAKLVDNVIDKKNDVYEKAMDYILFSLLIMVLGVITFFMFYIENGITTQFIIKTTILAMVSSAAFILFNPQGKTYEKNRNKAYRVNSQSWGSLSLKVQDSHPKQFNSFCESETMLKREKKIKDYVRRAVVDYKLFEEEMKDLDKPDFLKYIKRKNEDGKDIFTKTQKKYLKRAKGLAWYSLFKDPLKIKDIEPTVILLGNETSKNYEVGEREKISVDKKIFLQRLFTTFAFSFLLALVGIVPTESVGLAMIAEYILRIAITFSSAVIGLYAGIYTIKVRNDRIKLNIHFIKTFFNVNKISKE